VAGFFLFVSVLPNAARRLHAHRPHHKPPRRRLQQKENVMRLITIFELATLKKSELQALFRETADELTHTREGSTERRNALGTLENIITVMRQRDHRQP
jgi:hypothetical protein